MLPKQKAIDFAARATIWSMYESWCELGWEDLPDFTEADYYSILERIAAWLPPDVTVYEMGRAWNVLSALANEEVDALEGTDNE